MASPTRAEIESQLSNFIRLFEQFRKFSGTHTAAGSSSDVGSNYLTMEDTLIQSLETNFIQQWGEGIAGVRAGLVNVLNAFQGGSVAGFLEYGKFIAATETDVPTILRRLYQYYIDNSLSVKSRTFTFATPPALTGTGTGVVNRLNKDENNYDIEAQTPDTKYIECIADEHSGADEHEELFEIRGSAPEPDALKIVGSGKLANIRAYSARDSFNFIDNPSFSQYSGTTTVPTDITNWTVGTSIGNFQIDTTNYYRDFVGDTTPASVRFSTNDSLTQNFNVRSARFDPFTPAYLQIAWNRSVGTGDGTLTLTLGSKSVSVVLAAQSGWQILRMTIGQDNWFSRWNQENPTVKVALSSRTTGYTLVDDVCISQYDNFDGSWYKIIGSATPFLRKDKGEWTDSAAEAAIIQRFLWIFWNAYLPTSGSPTWAEPSN
jgi:hypothetical protein